MTDNINDINTVKHEVVKLTNKIRIRKGTGLHDRFILTGGGVKDGLLDIRSRTLDQRIVILPKWHLR
jgi:hypothetical protein